MYKPTTVVKKVRKLIKKGYRWRRACIIVSEKYNLKLYDVLLVAVTEIPELYENWKPTREENYCGKLIT